MVVQKDANQETVSISYNEKNGKYVLHKGGVNFALTDQQVFDVYTLLDKAANEIVARTLRKNREKELG